ncbi:MAG: NAD(P)/FAD-dependent oxidoreductase [Rhodospirillales bacterium]|nr:MAG: NAD(P)/FAD-dependent oxidoreductase [Rhodospirillales bacterium]
MCGQTAAFGLLRDGVRKLRLVDRAPPGLEGPWGTYARMETLRSPKHLTGPDLGIPSLTFRAWYEALHGADGWASLYKVWRLDWLRYLVWVRRMVGLTVESGVEMLSLTVEGGAPRVELRTPAGVETVRPRKVVLALGRDGSGASRWPRFASFEPESPHARGRVFHTSDDIDFTALRGKRIGVLGAGASAFDNAGCALEAGAAEVTMFARRPALPQVNKSKAASFPGFQRGYAGLPDDLRWRFTTYLFDEQSPPPHESVLRCDRHDGFSLRLGETWSDLSIDPDGVRATTSAGARRFDAVIIATGFDVDVAERPELESLREHVTLWAHRRPPAEVAAYPDVARFPYLGPAFEFLPREPGACPGLSDIHVFNWGSYVSLGALAGDIPGLGVGATRLADAIVRDLFVADAEAHWRRLVDHEDPELAPTRYFVPRERR